ncbi:hypothetical protein ATANTOWER_000732, partial [Ataeniobius toweri]|nr:hypothetical protein [Ataeniobius toweri]
GRKEGRRHQFVSSPSVTDLLWCSCSGLPDLCLTYPVNSMDLLLANSTVSLFTSPAASLQDSEIIPKKTPNLCSPACPPSNTYRSSGALPSK